LGVFFLVRPLEHFDRTGSGPFTGVGLRDWRTETGAGGGRHPVADRLLICFALFAWLERAPEELDME